MDFAETQVPGTDQKVTFFKTHRGRAVTAAATLVKDQLAVFFTQLINHLAGFSGNRYPFYLHSEEAQLVLVVGHQYVLGVTVMIEHHPVSLASETGFLVTTK